MDSLRPILMSVVIACVAGAIGVGMMIMFSGTFATDTNYDEKVDAVAGVQKSLDNYAINILHVDSESNVSYANSTVGICQQFYVADPVYVDGKVKLNHSYVPLNAYNVSFNGHDIGNLSIGTYSVLDVDNSFILTGWNEVCI